MVELINQPLELLRVEADFLLYLLFELCYLQAIDFGACPVLGPPRLELGEERLDLCQVL